MINFRKVRTSARIHSPLADFAEVEVPYEIRWDPLTGRTARILGGDEIDHGDDHDFSELISSSEPCVFCGDNLFTVTPRYPENIITGGRSVRGQSVLFPNLRAYAGYAAVVAFSRRHFFPLPEISPTILGDALINAIDFAVTVYERDPSQRFTGLNWNYLPPSGSSIIHTHLQIIVDPLPMNAHRENLEAASAFRKEQGRPFHKELVQEEMERKERFLGTLGCGHWLTPFAPVGFHQIEGIFPEISLLADLGQGGLDDLVDGVLAALAYYYSAGLNSFNMVVFSAPLDGEFAGETAIHLILLARPRMRPYYRNDSSAYERLYRDSLTDLFPEDVARRARPFFAGK